MARKGSAAQEPGAASMPMPMPMPTSVAAAVSGSAQARRRRFDPVAGPVVGVVDGPVVRIRGVPYASAARFARPVPLPPFATPWAALHRAPAAPQRTPAAQLRFAAPDDLAQDEHCQRLTITAPVEVATGERLAVLVWLHGGSHVLGAGDLACYDPRDLVAEQRVVVVAVTSRLGLLALGDDRPDAANLGLLDQIAALVWVRDNIAAFGGDPSAVTLFGHSSGGDDAAHLMIADGTAGLFRRVIIQSAPLGLLTQRRAAMAAWVRRRVGRLPDGLGVDAVLRRQHLAGHAAWRFGPTGGMPYGPQAERPPLPAAVDLDASWRSVAPRFDVLIGATADEAALAALLTPAPLAPYAPALGPWLAAAIGGPFTRRIYDDPAGRFAARHRAAGGHALRYRITWRPPSSPLGAAHGVELPLLLGSRAAWAGSALLGSATRDVDGWTEVAQRGRAVRAAWAEFARTGRIRADVEAVTDGTLQLISSR